MSSIYLVPLVRLTATLASRAALASRAVLASRTQGSFYMSGMSSILGIPPAR
jgi:hypothetical protein